MLTRLCSNATYGTSRCSYNILILINKGRCCFVSNRCESLRIQAILSCGFFTVIISTQLNNFKSRKEYPQKLTQLGPRSHQRHLMGKRTAQRDTIKDITSDSQVNNYFPYRWSPASLTFNIYFYLFLYLYITRITINKDTPHLKSPKNQNRRAALGRPAI